MATVVRQSPSAATTATTEPQTVTTSTHVDAPKPPTRPNRGQQAPLHKEHHHSKQHSSQRIQPPQPILQEDEPPKTSVLTSAQWGVVHDITRRVLSKFIPEFEAALKAVWLESLRRANEEKKVSHPEATKSRQKYSAPDILPPTETALRVYDYVIIDDDVEPFILYVIKSTFGDETACVYRRFDQFKQLHQMVKKPSFIILPLDSRGIFGIRKDVSNEFARGRVPKLQNYLAGLLLATKSSQDSMSVLHKWLGFTPGEDQNVLDAFSIAFAKVVQEKRMIYYDDPVDALSKFIVSEAFEVFGQNVKHTGRTRRQSIKFLKSAYFDVAGVVTTDVHRTWDLVHSQVNILKQNVGQIQIPAVLKTERG